LPGEVNEHDPGNGDGACCGEHGFFDQLAVVNGLDSFVAFKKDFQVGDFMFEVRQQRDLHGGSGQNHEHGQKERPITPDRFWTRADEGLDLFLLFGIHAHRRVIGAGSGIFGDEKNRRIGKRPLPAKSPRPNLRPAIPGTPSQE
jgi:hypothetical protein